MEKSNLTRAEAEERAALVADLSYDVALDLSGDEESTFGSDTVIRFSCARPGAATFLDFSGASVSSVEVNGELLGPEAFDGDRIHMPGLAEENEVRVAGRAEYRLSGSGMSRFGDPVDGLTYAYTDFEPFDAHRVYPCFDQPDLKGRFAFDVVVPAGWEVVSNLAPSGEPQDEGDARRWSFPRTPPVPTYITAVAAGPFHAVRDRHGDIPLGVYCRRSLAEHLDPEEILEVTKQGFDFFERAFAYPYPFDKYDQLFVPQFNSGAMENAGCVTFNERYVFRSRVTDAARQQRAETILHEMAHMWFGDLVTMRWWNDLWLNESFATFASVLSEVSATRFREAWTVFANEEKTWAYRQDQLPTTHPIVADIPDVVSVHLNFDGITYAKGASVLRQLVAWVGQERFLEGMRRYFRSHEFANAELSDFLRALEEVSGRDLGSWSGEWLETAGVNTLRAEIDRGADGTLQSVAIRQEAPDEWPTLRSHRVALGLYDLSDGEVRRRRRVELDVVGERTPVAELEGEWAPDLLLVNDDDLTYAKVRLDDVSVATAMEHLADIPDSLPRAICWTALWDMTRDAELPARRYVDVVLRNIRGEREIASLQRLLGQAVAAAEVYGHPANRRALLSRVADAAREELERAGPGSDEQLAWARAFASSAVEEEQIASVAALLDGSRSVPELEVDTDLRWHLLRALAAHGRADDAAIAAELERDPSDEGRRQAEAARATRPTAEAKGRAWRLAVEDESQPLATIRHAIAGFQQPGQEELLAPYVERYFERLADVWERRDLPVALAVAGGLYPHNVVDQRVIDATDEHLRRTDLPGPVRRLLLEGKDGLRRALRAREADRRATEGAGSAEARATAAAPPTS